jgi:hypothetical protein
MGQVVPFIARVRDSGDWTTAERARLEALADRLSASGVDIEVIYGATDEGDPWCVVTDGAGDVLIHVARIGGMFVVHSVVDDAVNESVDLHVALRERLEATEDAATAQSATVLPFGLTARQGQTFLALVVAAAFFYETAGVGESAEAAELPPALPTEPDLPPPPDIDAPAQERDLATQGATLQQGSASGATAAAAVVLARPEPTAASAPAAEPAAPPPAAPIDPPQQASAKADVLLNPAAKAEAATVIRGTDGDDVLTGTSADEHIIGGAGNDTLRGGGGHDLLEGGAGDDRIELTSDTTALGGEGADTFVIQAPVQLGHADTLLGVVLDFSDVDGDKLVTWNGKTIHVPPHPAPGTDGGMPTLTATGGGGDRMGGGGDFTGQGVDPTHLTPTLAPTPGDGRGDFGPTLVGPPLTRVEIDFDGDGVFDGYVLVRAAGHAPSQGDDNAIVVTGRTLGGDDAFG